MTDAKQLADKIRQVQDRALSSSRAASQARSSLLRKWPPPLSKPARVVPTGLLLVACVFIGFAMAMLARSNTTPVVRDDLRASVAPPSSAQPPVDSAAQTPASAEPSSVRPAPILRTSPAKPEATESTSPVPSTATAPQRVGEWKRLIAEGRYVDAMREADQEGFDQIRNTASARDLLSLGEASRFTSMRQETKPTLLAVRKRFPQSAEAGAATFQLGRLASDDAHDQLGAAHWFQAYLSEYPQGDLAREASGRLVEALERGGDHAAARRAASRYLADYPHGPHATFARDVLKP